MTNEANKQTRVLRRLAMAGALIVAAGLGAGATFLGYGVDANLPWPVTANTTIAAKYCGGTVLAGTGSTGQFTLTLPAVTGFPSNCSVLIKNGDSSNGKILSGFPSDLNTILWPQQSLGVKIVNGAWQSFYNPGPWNAPAGGVTLYASTTGSDSNDCLTTGTACTLAGACQNRRQINTGRSGGFNIVPAHGTYTATDANSALCSVTGNGGGSSPALTSIIGDTAAPTAVVLAVPNNSLGVYAKDGGEVVTHDLEMTGGNGSTGIQCAGQNAVCDYYNLTWSTWGTGGAHISGSSGSYVNLLGGGESLISNFLSSIHWSLSGGATLTAGGPTNIPSAISWAGGSFLNATGNPFISLSGWSLTGAGVAGSTGFRAILTGPGYLVTAGAASCNSALPGSLACQITLGLQDNANDPLTSPWPAADLPPPTATTLGGIESIVAAAHQWIDSISTSGVPHQSQPATTDLSDVTAPTAWTATDGSGAGLTFTTNAETRYVKNGKVCVVSFIIQWPSTADTRPAQINGIPSACTAYSGTYPWVPGGAALTGISSIGSGIAWVALQAGGTSLFFFGNANQLTNANMSGGIVRGTITYITN
ncbi:MAG TPA: hypothetical protein VNZ48_10115 [Xanthobacteraceae bacterium]|nr:hypothetical protein [Xanthobacteraceae bacterium]